MLHIYLTAPKVKVMELIIRKPASFPLAGLGSTDIVNLEILNINGEDFKCSFKR